jgi:hypothetical protein
MGVIQSRPNTQILRIQFCYRTEKKRFVHPPVEWISEPPKRGTGIPQLLVPCAA